jgi:hypothetical protein
MSRDRAAPQNDSSVEIGDDDPITLAEACEWFFRDRITPATLRAERNRGRLATMKIGRTEFTTRAAIKEMKRLCQGHPNDPGSGSGRPESEPTGSRAKQPGSSSTKASISPRDALQAKLRSQTGSSPNTSRKSTSRAGLNGH